MAFSKPIRITLVGALVAGVAFAGAAGASERDPRASRRAMDPADQATARSLVVKPSEMSGWKPFGRHPQGGSGCPTFNPDLSAFTITGEFLGRQFVRRPRDTGEAFTSAVWIYENEKDAVGQWRIFTSAAAVECVRDQVSKAGPAGVLIAATSRPTPLRLPLVAPRQFSRRYLLLWVDTGGGGVGSIYLDTIVLGRGRAEVSLMFQRVGERDLPPLATLERQLTKLLGQKLARAFP